MFKSAISNSIGTSEVTLQTVPAGKTHIVLCIIAKNRTTSDVAAAVKVVKADSTTIDIIPSLPNWIPNELMQWEGKLILEAGDTIKAVSGTANSIDVMTNYTEDDA